ncbi:MAG: sulfatase [Candidatus Saliniplasma sp.]
MNNRNVLLITVDSLRWDAISDMPNIHAFAENNSYFTRAYTNGPSTPFSFPSLFNVNYDPIKDPIKIRSPTLTEELKNEGYETFGLVASNPYISALSGYQKGFDTFEDFITSEGREVRGMLWNLFQKFPNLFQNLRDVYKWYFNTDVTSSLSGKVTVDKSRSWLSDIKKSDRPFFFWVHFMDTHYPYTPPLKHTDFSLWDITSLNNFRKKRDLENTERSRRKLTQLKELYKDAAGWLDEQMKGLFDILKTLELWDDTDILITSDHGEGFGEHSFLGHPSQLYQEVVKIPLVAKIDGISGKENKMVELRDIPATYCSSSRRGGRDLRKTVNEKREIPLRARHAGNRSCMKKGMNLIDRPESLKYGIYGMVTERYKFIYDEEGSEMELYDLKRDPGEKTNISIKEKDIVQDFFNKLNIV